MGKPTVTAKKPVSTKPKKDEDENVIDIEKKKGERVSIQSGLSFFDFKANPEFAGKYVREQWADVMNKETKESEHKIIGYVFTDDAEEEILIGNSYAVEKALNTLVNGVPAKDGKFTWFITFTGVKELDGGRKVNQFKIEIE